MYTLFKINELIKTFINLIEFKIIKYNSHKRGTEKLEPTIGYYHNYDYTHTLDIANP